MDQDQLLTAWAHEQTLAHIKGWDFSHIEGRYREEDDLPWDFQAVIETYLTDDDQWLDMETGGGEFLLSLNHPPERTAAIEGFAPNIELCKETLVPLGIRFEPADGSDPLPFDDDAFDVITNRHGSYDVSEIRRTLKPGGVFITQQVGAENDLELIELLMGRADVAFPEAYLDKATAAFENHGFNIVQSMETHRPIEFYDVGALVWYARIIEWEFPGFSVETHRDNLLKAQALLEREGRLSGSIHRYYFVARKHDGVES